MRLLSLTGQRFGRLIVGERAPNRAGGRHVAWLCRCDCGAEITATTVHLRSGHTLSCGCLSKEMTAARSRTHGHTLGRGHGRRVAVSPEYSAWCSAKARTTNPRNKQYDRYGGRGIYMAAEWVESFERFLADMGPRPKGTSIDRIDNDRGYEPGNCRWATRMEQANNVRDNIRVVYAGQSLTLAEVAATVNVPYLALYKPFRLRGVPLDQAIERAKHSRAKRRVPRSQSASSLGS